MRLNESYLCALFSEKMPKVLTDYLKLLHAGQLNCPIANGMTKLGNTP